MEVGGRFAANPNPCVLSASLSPLVARSVAYSTRISRSCPTQAAKRLPPLHAVLLREEAAMTNAELAIFVLAGFLVPVPLLAWLDRPRDRR